MEQATQNSGLSDLNPHFDALFEKALDAVVGMDMAGKIIAWNTSAAELFGWTSAEATGTLMSDLIIPHQHRKSHDQGLKQYRHTGQGPVLNNRVQITALRRGGQEFPIELSIVPIPSGDGTVFYAFIRSREEEERLNTERDLRTREAEVLAAISAAHLENMDIGDFIRFCLERICHVSGWAVGHFYRFDNPNKPALLVPSGVWYISDPQFQSAVDVTGKVEFAKSEGMPGRVWESNAAVIVDDIRNDEGFIRRVPFLNVGLTKGFAFPLRNCGNLSGVMEFFGSDFARTGPELTRFADNVGSHVELALQRKTEHDTRELLRRELSHRVGNSLAVLNSLFRRCCVTATDVNDLRARFEPRLMAVGHAHRMIASNDEVRAQLHKIVQTAVQLLPETERITVEGPELVLDGRLVLPLTLILHELVTNSIKYGIWHREGELQVTWRIESEKTLHLIWREFPAQHVGNTIADGYGSVLMRAMAEGTMNGRLVKYFEDGAFVARLDVPLL